MRIGILTFHRACNYGAFLQCYSLVTSLKESFPKAQFEVIDYESQNMANYYRTDMLSLLFGHSNITSNKSIRKRLSTAKHFLKKISHDHHYIERIKERNTLFSNAISQLPLSQEKLVSDDLNKFITFVNAGNYDLIIVGSDAIWNDSQTSVPNVYYLDPRIKARRAAYAASTFGMNFKHKNKEDIQRIAENVRLFDFVGTRDAATEDYVRLLDPSIKAFHTCDPSIFLNLHTPIFDYQVVKRKLDAHGVSFSRPIFGIMGGDWLGRIARDLIGEEGQLVAIYEPNAYADVYIHDLTPWEWAVVFSFFTMTFTHFFHGTLFSLKNGTPTMSIEWENNYSANFDTKILDVLKRLGLSNYRYTKKQAEQTPELLRTHFSHILGHLEEEKEQILVALAREADTMNSFMHYLAGIIGGNCDERKV